MGVRRQSRHTALQALYMCDSLGNWDNQENWEEENIKFFFEHFSVSRSVRSYAERLCFGVIKNMAVIDSKLTCASENWSLSRMGRVDKAILRLGAYEILFRDDVPVNVAINEAIEVAKSFGAGESPVFVNGVLDKVASSNRSDNRSELVPEVLNLRSKKDSASDIVDVPLLAGEKVVSE